MPTISPSTRATSRCDAGDVAISLELLGREGGGAELDSCGISRANASTISGVTASQTLTDTVIAVEANAYTPSTYVLPGGCMHDDEVRAKARKLRDLVEVVAASVYFLPEAHAAYKELGLPDFGPPYFASRGALHGPGAGRGRHRGVRCVQSQRS